MPQEIVAMIGGNAAEPSGKRGLEIVTPNCPKRLEKYFLAKVLHLIAPAYQMINQRKYTLLVLLHQGPEGLCLPLLRPFNPLNLLGKLYIGVFHRSSILRPPSLFPTREKPWGLQV